MCVPATGVDTGVLLIGFTKCKPMTYSTGQQLIPVLRCFDLSAGAYLSQHVWPLLYQLLYATYHVLCPLLCTAQVTSQGGSKSNEAEAALVVRTVMDLVTRGGLDPRDIGVVTPYVAQVGAHACVSPM
jgi:hypothetical protein